MILYFVLNFPSPEPQSQLSNLISCEYHVFLEYLFCQQPFPPFPQSTVLGPPFLNVYFPVPFVDPAPTVFGPPFLEALFPFTRAAHHAYAGKQRLRGTEGPQFRKLKKNTYFFGVWVRIKFHAADVVNEGQANRKVSEEGMKVSGFSALLADVVKNFQGSISITFPPNMDDACKTKCWNPSSRDIFKYSQVVIHDTMLLPNEIYKISSQPAVDRIFLVIPKSIFN